MDLEIWKESRVLVNKAYQATQKFPQEEMYGLVSQIRRCSVSIPSNIAEGCGRRTSADTIQFLHIARGSIYELETQFYLSLDQSFVTQIEFDDILIQIIKCKKLLNGFINYYRNNK